MSWQGRFQHVALRAQRRILRALKIGLVEPRALKEVNLHTAAARPAFQRGQFHTAMKHIEAAGTLTLEIRHGKSFNAMPVTLLGSEVLNAFGHLAIGPTLRVKAAELGLTTGLPVMLCTPEAANAALMSYWGQYLPSMALRVGAAAAIERTLWPIVDSVQWMEIGGQCRHLYSVWAQVEQEWEAAAREPVLSVSDDHREQGRALLRSRGIRDDDWFVSLHVRAIRGGDNYGRNARESTYLEAVRRIHDAGGRVVQLGHEDLTAPPLPGVVSLALERVDRPWTDLFLLGTARFHIGTQSGPTHAANAFGTPVLWTNVTGWGFLPYIGATVAVPKTVTAHGKALSLADLAHSGLAFNDGYLPVDDRRLAWLDNTPEQVVHGVDLMLQGRWAGRPDAASDLDLLHQELVGYPGITLLESLD